MKMEYSRSTTNRPPRSARASIPKEEPSTSVPSLYSVRKSSALHRLARPKTVDPRYLPDKPSVYWLDYLLDETPRTMKDPKELASYYEKFEEKFPRTRVLSSPRPKYDEERGPLSARPSTSQNNVKLSALTYKTSDRIRDLSRPRSAISSSAISPEEKKVNRRSMSASRSRSNLSLPSARTPTPTLTAEKESSLESKRNNRADFSRGDFSSTTKVNYHQLGEGMQTGLENMKGLEESQKLDMNRSRPRIRHPFSISQ